jgi:hypothetical protein
MKRLRLETLQSDMTAAGDAPISLTAMARVRSSAQLSEGLPRLGAVVPKRMVSRLQRRMDLLPPQGSADGSL